MANGEINVRIRYFAIILFQADMVFGEGMNLHKGHGQLVQAHSQSLYHLHDPSNESVNAGRLIIVYMGLHLASNVRAHICHFPRRGFNFPCHYWWYLFGSVRIVTAWSLSYTS